MATKPDFPFPLNPDSSVSVASDDLRAQFEALSRQTPRNPQAERAFVDHKLELIRTDPLLSEAQKEQAIAELRQRLESFSG